MKKTTLIIALLFSGFAFQPAIAQIRLGLNVNIGLQPLWGPVGYDHVEYYYMPDIDVFYYVPNHQYIYQERGRWIFSASLPPRYSDYDVYGGYKVVINDAFPYHHVNSYRRQYAAYKGNHGQDIIRNSRDSRYFENKNHPRHNEWKVDRGNDRRNNENNRGNDSRNNKNDRNRGDNDRRD